MAKIQSDIGSAAGLLWERGLVDGSAGNISVLSCAEGPAEGRTVAIKLRTPLKMLRGMNIHITSSGSRMYMVRREPDKFIVKCTLSEDCSALLCSGSSKPSSELAMHAHIYNAVLSSGRSAGCIVHAHPPYLTALTLHTGNDEKGMNSILSSAHFEFSYMFPRGIGCIGCIEPGTQELASACEEKFSDYDAVIIEKHGAVACGEDYESAFDKIDSSEAVAKIFMLSGGLLANE